MKKLFYDNAYLNEWESEIVEVTKKYNKYYISLSETAFYPESGGQPSDVGEIDEIKVIDVIELNGIIYHVLDSKPHNKKVVCKIDFDRRFDFMQQHTGQHLFSAIFYNKYKFESTSFRIDDEFASIVIPLNNLQPSMIKEVENIANEYVFKNLKIITHTITADEIHKFQNIEIPITNEPIRIVEIDKIDFCPCCGTHVENTCEIGLIKVMKIEKFKDSTKIFLKCGKRALQDFQNKIDLVSHLKKSLSVPESDILKKVEDYNIEIKTLLNQLSYFKEIQYEKEAKEIADAATQKLIYMIDNEKSFNDIKVLTKHLLQNGDFILIFASSIDRKVFLCHNGNAEVDFKKLLKEHLPSFNGRGGGNFKQAQAAFEDLESMKKFIDFIKENILID
ncbi:DHHA1 domain-containing protein [Clostridium sp. L74]|uniref:alanyl-tRNA editing protein n=1 Tax=Clostridium sp. L74 TaxID=1560217 RepID=UPI0006AB9122|nr:DHHA1 domain-containing protein [Clostridium sp. L74]EJP6472174.1 alanyl-tRNA editing protein [Clostridium botulinum]KOR26222.1 hypothetical protein ND00_09060 [Clostridium sp. L74]